MFCPPSLSLILQRMLVAAKSFLGWHRRGRAQGGDWGQPYHRLGSCLDILDLSFSTADSKHGLYRTKSAGRYFYWSCPRLMSQRVYGPCGAWKGHNHIFIVADSSSCSDWGSFKFGIVLAIVIKSFPIDLNWDLWGKQAGKGNSSCLTKAHCRERRSGIFSSCNSQEES